MPLHFSPLVTRHALTHPEEKPAQPALAFEHVLKFNPNHDKSTGRFTSGSGGGGGKGSGAGRMGGYTGGKLTAPRGGGGSYTAPTIHNPPATGKITAGKVPRKGGVVDLPTYGTKGKPDPHFERGTPIKPHVQSDGRATMEIRDTKGTPKGTLFFDDKFLVPTDEDVPSDSKWNDTKNHPLGTLYVPGSGTFIPRIEGGYSNIHAGKVYRAYGYNKS